MEKPIMGSETEFSIIPRGGTWPAESGIGRLRIRYLIKLLDAEFFPGYPRFQEVNIDRLERAVNWWKEDLKRKETSEKRSYATEVLRRMGISGTYAHNGARVYIDGSHPEYSTPECTNPFELVTYERAGESIMRRVIDELEERLGVTIDLLKRNWSPRSNVSYACHENYLIPEALFKALTCNRYSITRREQAFWVLHLISRQIFTGSGRFDATKKWPECFSLSQRQPFIGQFASITTLGTRPLINLRDRPYADPKKWSRLHVICGDGNRADLSNILKYGTSCLVLLMLGDCKRRPLKDNFPLVQNPVGSFRGISNKDSMITTRQGSLTALEGQRALLEEVMRWHEWRVQEGQPIEWFESFIEYWSKVLDMLCLDDDALYRRLDSFIKYSFLLEAHERGKSSRELQSLDYSYHLVGSKSLFDSLLGVGRAEALISLEEIKYAKYHPPKSRAALRTRIVRAFGDRVRERSWHIIGIVCEDDVVLVCMPDPRSDEIYVTDESFRDEIENVLRTSREDAP